MTKPTIQEVVARAKQEAEAELLTRLAEQFVIRASEAWSQLDASTNRDDCDRARRLLPGSLP